MTTKQPQTHNDALLAVAASFGDREFTESELAIAAWQAAPNRFGMAGHQDNHPCTNKVRSLLCGARGLVAAGLVERASGNLRLTEAGRSRVKNGPAPKKPVVSTNKPKISPHRADWLAAAIKRYKMALPVDRSTLADALRFWECQDYSLPTATKEIDQKLRDVIDAFRKRDTIELPCGMQVDRDLVCSILDYHMRLAQRFERTIKTIAARSA